MRAIPLAYTERAKAQRRIIAKLTEELRAEKILVNALSSLSYLPSQQSPAVLARVRRALEGRAA